MLLLLQQTANLVVNPIPGDPIMLATLVHPGLYDGSVLKTYLQMRGLGPDVSVDGFLLFRYSVVCSVESC